ncbi:Ankyrin repeat protein 1 [Giardia muris]|uniref:Ankyrin repeat protein 1 n=1 Tax=Giardia muris TaxID=5742 RepID=A0A4Z1SQC3_GIAMU|nr:Ankyrin repeat protein 1 [Giardia muris]|eukprot:TNJ27105.1 Ankyrin repeat protein 1 [Giardia muris]
MDAWFDAASSGNVAYILPRIPVAAGTRDAGGATALIRAARANNSMLALLLLKYEHGVVDALGRSALYEAVEHENVTLVKAIAPFEFGLQLVDDKTALELALEGETITRPVIDELVVGQGVAVDWQGRSCLDVILASRHPEAYDSVLFRVQFQLPQLERSFIIAQQYNLPDTILDALRQHFTTAHVAPSAPIAPSPPPSEPQSTSSLQTKNNQLHTMRMLLDSSSKNIVELETKLALAQEELRQYRRQGKVIPSRVDQCIQANTEELDQDVDQAPSFVDESTRCSIVEDICLPQDAPSISITEAEIQTDDLVPSYAYTWLEVDPSTGAIITIPTEVSVTFRPNDEFPPAERITPLIQAVKDQDIRGVQDHIGFAGQGTRTGKTALMYAAQLGFVEAVRYLIPYEAKKAETWNFFIHPATALQYAAVMGHTECVEELLPHEAGMTSRFGWTALMFAAVNNRVSSVVALAEREAGARTASNFAIGLGGNGNTALILAAKLGHRLVCEALGPLEANIRDGRGMLPATVARDPKLRAYLRNVQQEYSQIPTPDGAFSL